MKNVFLNSIVNGADNHQDKLPEYKWAWPKDTYLQRQLKRKREQGLNYKAVEQAPTD